MLRTGSHDAVAASSSRARPREFKIIEIRIRRRALPLDLPDPRVRFVVRLFLERGDESRAVPLQAIVGQRRIIAVVERDDMGTFVTTVARIFGVFAPVPVERELVGSRIPLLIRQPCPQSRLVQPIKFDRAHLVAEAVPDFQHLQRHRGSIRTVAEGVNRQTPERRPILRQYVKPNRPALDRSDSKGTNLYKLTLMRPPVVKKLFAEQTVKTWNVGVERRQLDVITSGKR